MNGGRVLAWLEQAQAPRIVPLLRIALCGVLVFDRMWRLGPSLRSLGARPHILDAPAIELLGLPWPAPGWVPDVLTVVLPLLGVCACIGLFTRVSLAFLCVLWIYPGAAEAGWGFFNHTPALPFQLVCVLALIPGSDAYSVDRWLRARRDGGPVVWAPPAARWGEVLVLSVIGAFYFTAGLSKLRYGAESFLDGTSLTFYLSGKARMQYWFGPLEPNPALLWKDGFQIDGYVYLAVEREISKAVAQHRWLVIVLSWLAVVVELLAWPALLASARIRAPFVVILQLFHIGMNVMIGPAFLLWQVAVACAFPFVEVRAWWRRLRQRAGAAG